MSCLYDKKWKIKYYYYFFFQINELCKNPNKEYEEFRIFVVKHKEVKMYLSR